MEQSGSKVVAIMFLGEHQHSLDAKGRMIVPAKFRDELGQIFVITKGIDKCLSAYPIEEWKAFMEKLKSLPTTDAEMRKFVRFIVGGAHDCESDNQGRVVIPPALREYANITAKEIVSVGLNNRIEIWSKNAWDNYNDDSNFIDDELAKKMSALGI